MDAKARAYTRQAIRPEMTVRQSKAKLRKDDGRDADAGLGPAF